MSQNHVYPAEPYRQNQMGSFGKAKHMLICQFQFPFFCEEEEKIASAYSDRLVCADFIGYRTCFVKHTGEEDNERFEHWTRNSTNEKVFAFLKALLKLPASAPYTGYRITGSVGGNGHAIWYFELFAKKEGSSTAVYTGENSPNVLPNPRRP